MERSITGGHRDGAGEWVVELDCGHDHAAHRRPPAEVRARVLDPDGRTAPIGTPLACPPCDRAEMPECVVLVRTTPVWDERTMPAGLRRDHRIAAATWGRLQVHEGRLRFTAGTSPMIRAELVGGATQAIPPGVEHRVEPVDAARFSLEFLTVDRDAAVPAGADLRGPRRSGDPGEPDEGGDPACWARLVCPGCGAIVEGGDHRAGCPAAGTTG